MSHSYTKSASEFWDQPVFMARRRLKQKRERAHREPATLRLQARQQRRKWPFVFGSTQGTLPIITHKASNARPRVTAGLLTPPSCLSIVPIAAQILTRSNGGSCLVLCRVCLVQVVDFRFLFRLVLLPTCQGGRKEGGVGGRRPSKSRVLVGQATPAERSS